jgi:hypothetical protein
MKGSDIVELVIVKLEEKSAFLAENGKGGPILSGGDNIDELKPVYSYINAHIEQAANEVLLVTPLNRLIPLDGSEVQDEDGGYVNRKINNGRIVLPNDFLRLYSIQAQDWERPVHKAITKTDHLYTLQHNKFTKGTKIKPVVVYSGVRGSNDEQYLDLYSTDKELTKEFLYIPVYTNETEYNRDVAEAIALNCAKKVLEVYSMTDKALAMNNELNSVLSNMNL